jgi:hypothetical protein
MYIPNNENRLNSVGSSLIKKEIKEHKEEKECLELNKIILEHDYEEKKIKIDHDYEEKSWRSCCFQLEKQSSLFFGKMIISLICIILCGYQLIFLKECQYQSLYSSILTSIITYWLNHKNQ